MITIRSTRRIRRRGRLPTWKADQNLLLGWFSTERDAVMVSDKISDDMYEMVEEYAQKEQTRVSMDVLMKTGRRELIGKSYRDEAMGLGHRQATDKTLIQISNFLRNELPVRLAHRIQDLDQVPLMRDMASVQLVKGIYLNSFESLVKYGPIVTPQDESEFAAFLQRKYELHSNVLIQMARGAFELRQAIRANTLGSLVDISHDSDNEISKCPDNLPAFEQMQEIHSFLDRFYMSRIGIRVLAGQYLALRQKPCPGYVGMVCLETSPYQLVKQAASDATQMCRRRYGIAPLVEIKGRFDLTYPYIPTYLHYMLLEVLKNAMRATVENSMKHDETLQPVNVIISDGMENEDVVIKVADVGGGIARSQWKKVWSYLFTTADPNVQRDFIGDKDHDSTSSPLAGLGFGLPISRSYARYFHGDLDLKSMEGYGTDAYIHLARLEDPGKEFS